jgi:hypothetical protein
MGLLLSLQLPESYELRYLPQRPANPGSNRGSTSPNLEPSIKAKLFVKESVESKSKEVSVSNILLHLHKRGLLVT